MALPGARQRIQNAVLEWEGVTEHAHRFGGTEYRLGKREIGHIHGDALVDIPFPKAVRDELVASGRAEPHHVLPDSGWVSVYIRTEPNVQHAINLLKRSLDIARASRHRIA